MSDKHEFDKKITIGSVLAGIGDYALRASIVLFPAFLAVNAGEVVAAYVNNQGWPYLPEKWGLSLVPIFFALFLGWYSLRLCFGWYVQDQRSDEWSNSEDQHKAVHSLVKTIVAYAESQNHATRSFVVGVAGLTLGYQVIRQLTELHGQNAWWIGTITCAISIILIVVSIALQNSIRVQRDLIRPLCYLVQAAHSRDALGAIIAKKECEARIEDLDPRGFRLLFSNGGAGAVSDET